MLTVVRLGSVRAAVFASNSRTRSVRLIAADHTAEVSTATLEIITGYVPRDMYEVFKAWAADHMVIMDEAWVLVNG